MSLCQKCIDFIKKNSLLHCSISCSSRLIFLLFILLTQLFHFVDDLFQGKPFISLALQLKLHNKQNTILYSHEPVKLQTIEKSRNRNENTNEFETLNYLPTVFDTLQLYPLTFWMCLKRFEQFPLTTNGSEFKSLRPAKFYPYRHLPFVLKSVRMRNQFLVRGPEIQAGRDYLLRWFSFAFTRQKSGVPCQKKLVRVPYLMLVV